MKLLLGSSVHIPLIPLILALFLIWISPSHSIHTGFSRARNLTSTFCANVDAKMEGWLQAQTDAYIEHFWTDPSAGIDRAYIRMIPVGNETYVPRFDGNPLFYYINEFAISSEDFDQLYVSYVNVHANLPRYESAAGGQGNEHEQGECCKIKRQQITAWCRRQFEIVERSIGGLMNYAVVPTIVPCYRCQQVFETKKLRKSTVAVAGNQRVSIEEAFIGSMALLHGKGKVLGCATLWPHDRQYWQTRVNVAKEEDRGIQIQIQGMVTFATMRRNSTRILADLQCQYKGGNEDKMCIIHWKLLRKCPKTAGHLFDIDNAGFESNNNNNKYHKTYNKNSTIIGGRFVTRASGMNAAIENVVVANSWSTQLFRFEPSQHCFLMIWWKGESIDSSSRMTAYPSSTGADDTIEPTLFDGSSCIPIKEMEMT